MSRTDDAPAQNMVLVAQKEGSTCYHEIKGGTSLRPVCNQPSGDMQRMPRAVASNRLGRRRCEQCAERTDQLVTDGGVPRRGDAETERTSTLGLFGAGAGEMPQALLERAVDHVAATRDASREKPAEVKLQAAHMRLAGVYGDVAERAATSLEEHERATLEDVLVSLDAVVEDFGANDEMRESMRRARQAIDSLLAEVDADGD